MHFYSQFFLVFLLPSLCLLQEVYNVVTDPERKPGQDKITVLSELGEDVTILCSITKKANNEAPQSVMSSWTLKSSGIDTVLSSFSNSGQSLDAPYIQVVGSYHMNLTVSNFSTSENMIELICSAGTASEAFLFGLPVPPALLIITDIVNETENNDLLLNITDPEAPAPFPPELEWRVTRDGYLLDEASIMLSNYTLEVLAINRNQSGWYNISVFNDAGNTYTSFEINVQYAPEAQNVSNLVYALVGENISLTAFTDIGGNPSPNAQWRDNSDAAISLEGRYTAPNLGQLRIQEITTNDFGTYKCILENTIGSIMNGVTLQLASPPGPPLMLQYNNLNITDVSVTLQWLQPTDIGGPMLAYYKVNISPMVATSPTTDTTLKISGLMADTMYSANVVAVSSKFLNGGNTSNTVHFIIDNEEPVFQSSKAIPLNGEISVMWNLKHTGGYDRSSLIVEVQCYRADDIGSGNGSIDTDLISTCNNNCIDEDLFGAAQVGPVYAGIAYDCDITVSIDLYSVEEDLNTIIPQQGIPSPPVIVSAMPGNGTLILTLLTVYPGIHNSEDNLKFKITLTTVDNNILEMDINFIGYISNTQKIVNLSVPAGEYYITVVANNRYGNSEDSNQLNVTVYPPIITPTTSVQPSQSSVPTEKTNYIGAIIGVAVGGIAVLLLIAALIAIIICFCLKRRRKGHYQYYRPTELDTVAAYRDTF